MTSKKLYNSIPKYIKQQLDATRTMIFLVALAYLVIGPVFLTFQMSLYKGSMRVLPMLEVLLNTYYVPYYLIGILFATTGAFMLTRYQNVAKQSDFYHSLPVSRGHLLAAKIFALVLVQALLLLLCVVAVVVAGIIYASRLGATDLIGSVIETALLQYAYIMLAFVLAMAVALFAGQLTASTFGQVLMTIVLHLTFPLVGLCGVTMLGEFTASYFSGGVFARIVHFSIFTPYLQNSDAMTTWVNGLNPMTITDHLAEVVRIDLLVWPLAHTLLYILLSVLLLVLTFKLYQHRAVEKAGDTLMYNWIGSVVKGIYVLLGGFFGGVICFHMSGNHFWGFVLGAMLAAVVVHLIAEMIYSQSMKGVLTHRLSTVIALALSLLLGLSGYYGYFDYDGHMPKQTAVKHIRMAFSGEVYGDRNLTASQDAHYIEKVIAAMEQAQKAAKETDIEDLPVDETGATVNTYIEVDYETTIGGSTERGYQLTEAAAAAVIAPLLNETDYHTSLYPSLMNNDVNGYTQFMLNANSFGEALGGQPIGLIDHTVDQWEEGLPMPRGMMVEENRAYAEALLEAIQADLPKRNQKVLGSRCLGTLYYETNDGVSGNITLYEGDKQTNALLQQWRKEGTLGLGNEADQYKKALQHIDIQTVTYGDNRWDYQTKQALDTDAFVDAWLNGEYIISKQAECYSIPANKKQGVILQGSDDGGDTHYTYVTLYETDQHKTQAAQ